ncbi:MAG: O-antigen ligase family protein [Parvularculaceae bacterium]|nr:O-antigen ligase family protein [Parvularculaceae bacterium]
MMIEALKALVVVLIVNAGAFVFARMAFREFLSPAVIDRWRNILLLSTVAAFLIPNFWLMLVVIGVIAAMSSALETVRPAIYLLLLFAIPAADQRVPGFFGINNFLNLAPFNVLALVVLFPLLGGSRETRDFRNVGGLADLCFIAFSVLSLALAFRDTTATDGIRRFAAYVLTAFGPYLAFSRYYWPKDRLAAGTLACLIPLIAIAGAAVVETILHWHVYVNAVENWNIRFSTRYLARSGLLRAYGPVFGPITLGLYFVVAFSLALAFFAAAKRKLLPAIAVGAIGVGLIVTFSRGPWVGAAFAVFMIAATAERPMAWFIRLVGVGFVATTVLLMTPFGPQLFNMLPFVGEVESNTIDYRQRLFEVGWAYVMKYPLFGSDGYLNAPELQSLVQGQGIIDIVNSYLQVALDRGIVGLALFVGVSLFAALSAMRAIGVARRFDNEYALYVQAWFAALMGVMLTLATTTNVNAQIAETHWLLCGICVGIARSVQAVAAAKVNAFVDDEPPPGPPGGPEDPPPGRSLASARTLPADNLPKHLRQYADR